MLTRMGHGGLTAILGFAPGYSKLTGKERLVLNLHDGRKLAGNSENTTNDRRAAPRHLSDAALFRRHGDAEAQRQVAILG